MTQTRGRPRHKAPTLPRVAALYARVSKAIQGTEDKASLPTQLAAMRAYAEEHGYAVTEEFTEQGQKAPRLEPGDEWSSS
jgi:hypothetical protein